MRTSSTIILHSAIGLPHTRLVHPRHRQTESVLGMIRNSSKHLHLQSSRTIYHLPVLASFSSVLVSLSAPSSTSCRRCTLRIAWIEYACSTMSITRVIIISSFPFRLLIYSLHTYRSYFTCLRNLLFRWTLTRIICPSYYLAIPVFVSCFWLHAYHSYFTCLRNLLISMEPHNILLSFAVPFTLMGDLIIQITPLLPFAEMWNCGLG